MHYFFSGFKWLGAVLAIECKLPKVKLFLLGVQVLSVFTIECKSYTERKDTVSFLSLSAMLLVHCARSSGTAQLHICYSLQECNSGRSE